LFRKKGKKNKKTKKKLPSVSGALGDSVDGDGTPSRFERVEHNKCLSRLH
jgi:hypothetical protein